MTHADQTHSGRGRVPSLIRKDDALLVATRVIERKMDPYLGSSLLGLIATGLTDVPEIQYFGRTLSYEGAVPVGEFRTQEILAACATLVEALREG